jgi:hypothetical protein
MAATDWWKNEGFLRTGLTLDDGSCWTPRRRPRRGRCLFQQNAALASAFVAQRCRHRQSEIAIGAFVPRKTRRRRRSARHRSPETSTPADSDKAVLPGRRRAMIQNTAKPRTNAYREVSNKHLSGVTSLPAAPATLAMPRGRVLVVRRAALNRAGPRPATASVSPASARRRRQLRAA